MSRDSFAMVLDFNLTTIATFMLMGYLTFVAGFTRDIYDTTRVWFSRTAGGLAVASIVGCASFAAVSGSSLATAAAMGKIAVPEMLRRGYDKGLATGVIAASGTLGSLIPPSVLMILYAVFTGESIALLFIAGVIPGVLSAGIYVTMILIRARLNPKLAPGMATSTTWSQKFRSLKGACAIVVLFIIVMGGIMTGFFTPMEAGAFGAAGAFSIATVSGRMTYRRFKTAMLDVLRQAAAIFAIIFGAIIFALALNIDPLM